MKRLKILLCILCFICLATSCANKTSHIQDFDDFVTDIEQKSDTFTDAEWAAAEAEFQHYVDITVEKYGSSLTSEDRERLGAIEKRYWNARMYMGYRNIAITKED